MAGVAQLNLRDRLLSNRQKLWENFDVPCFPKHVQNNMSDRWSAGSIYHPSSQPRKISIGVMADSLGKKRPEAAKADEVAIPNEVMVKSVTENAKEVNNRVEGVIAGTVGKHTEAPVQASSPSVTERSTYKKHYAPETPLCPKQGFSIPSLSGRQNKQGGEDVSATNSIHSLANRTSVLQSVQSKQKMYDGDTQKSKERRDGTADMVEELAFTTGKEVKIGGKPMTETITDKTENGCSRTLKVKLWEILGNTSSAKDHDPQSHSLKVDVNRSMPIQNLGRTETVGKHGQNSDTIETDSENPSHSIRRPVTRSLGRKRAPKKVHQIKVKDKAPSICKQKQQEKNIFSFVDKSSGRLPDNNNVDSSRFTKKRSAKQSSRTGLQKNHCIEKDNANKVQQKTAVSEVVARDEKSSSLGTIGRFRDLPLQSDRYQPKNDIEEKNPHHSSMANKADQGDLNSPKLSDNQDQPQCFANISSKNVVDPEIDFQSPTFGIKTPIPNSSPSPVPKSNQMEKGVCSPASEEGGFSARDYPSFRRTSKLNSHGSNEDARETKTSPCRKSASILEDKNADDGMTESSSEEGTSESSEEGCRERIAFSPDAGTAVKPKITLKSVKRLRNYGDSIFKEFSSTAPPPKGAAGSDWMQEPPEQTQEDELARAVTLFTRALKGIKSKIKLAAGKKSSEVLTSVAEGISLQLENIHSQIQTDIEKLTSVSISKRRRLETKFQDQQEQLHLIHGKFKEEVNQHLQECKETLSGLEAHQIEYKGTTEKQRASNRKLLLQVNESIDMQLNDAQKRIIAINKLAREQMLELKHAISECLKDGVSN